MRLITKLLIMGILFLSVATIVINYEHDRFKASFLNVPKDGFVYTVKPGSNLKQISRDLKNAGISPFPVDYLYIYGRLQNKAHLIKTGEYLIKENTTLPELLEQLTSGKVIQYAFTIVEGLNSQQLIDMLINDSRIKKTLTETDLASVMVAIEYAGHGEGEFLPETYFFTAGTSDKQLLQRAHQLMTSVLDDAWKNKAENLPYKTKYDALIMASIIEKETGIAEERAQIAGVFVRRLEKGMRLQTDPTVIYGMGEQYKGNIRRKDLRKDTPYNTYTRYGLPPTPIALPSKEAIHAALHPADGKSLYFVATGQDGRHIFSNTLTAHNKAVRKYQLKKKK
ncbi:MAG: endolytic transglycosylase MltG [Methylophaga sp.]|nr:endolytic transglycosylase MltG [Methylophaga sp.]